jgi:hypothetical protein
MRIIIIHNYYLGPLGTQSFLCVKSTDFMIIKISHN